MNYISKITISSSYLLKVFSNRDGTIMPDQAYLCSGNEEDVVYVIFKTFHHVAVNFNCVK